MNGKNELSFWGRAVYDKTIKIIGRAFDDVGDAVHVKVNVPEDSFRIPNGQIKRDSTVTAVPTPKTSSDKADLLSKALAVILPAGLVFIGNIAGANVHILAILAGIGGLIGSFIGNIFSDKAAPVESNEHSHEEIQAQRLKPEDIRVRFSAADDEKKKILSRYAQEIERLCQEISAFEIRSKRNYNVATDIYFGEWLQRFFIFAAKNPNDRKIQRLHDDLFAVLAPMGIKVYDDAALKEGRLKADGTPDVPVQEYLIDNRQGTNYNRVSRPAIYSDEQVLARGEIS